MFEILVGQYRFMARRKFAYMFSGTLTVLSIISLIAHGGPRSPSTSPEETFSTWSSTVRCRWERSGTPVGASGMESAEVQMAQENTPDHRCASAPTRADDTNYFQPSRPDNTKNCRGIPPPPS